MSDNENTDADTKWLDENSDGDTDGREDGSVVFETRLVDERTGEQYAEFLVDDRDTAMDVLEEYLVIRFDITECYWSTDGDALRERARLVVSEAQLEGVVEARRFVADETDADDLLDALRESEAATNVGVVA